MVFGHSPVSCKHLQAFLLRVNSASFLDCFPEMTKHEQYINGKNTDGDRETELERERETEKERERGRISHHKKSGSKK